MELEPEPTKGISLTSPGLDHSCWHITTASAATTAEEEYAELRVAVSITSPSPSLARVVQV